MNRPKRVCFADNSIQANNNEKYNVFFGSWSNSDIKEQRSGRTHENKLLNICGLAVKQEKKTSGQIKDCSNVQINTDGMVRHIRTKTCGYTVWRGKKANKMILHSKHPMWWWKNNNLDSGRKKSKGDENLWRRSKNDMGSSSCKKKDNIFGRNSKFDKIFECSNILNSSGGKFRQNVIKYRFSLHISLRVPDEGFPEETKIFYRKSNPGAAFL